MVEPGRRRARSSGMDDLRRGRDAFVRRAWSDAYAALCAADRAGELGGEDLERLATAAHMIGREQDYLATLERAHHAYVAAGDAPRAIRCGFWLGMRLAQHGETARGSGWLSRAGRLLEELAEESAEHGYMMLPEAQRHLAGGDPDAAARLSGRAAALGDRSGDVDLAALARHLQGRCLLLAERVGEGLALLDDAMLAVAAGAVSPLVTGIVYCSVIEGCRQVFAFDRAREWTAALTEWCDRQQDLHAFTGSCLVHRAEILELRGAWPDALDEARRAAERLDPAHDPQAYAAAWYQMAEVNRLRGDVGDAEAAYRRAGETGWEPQPGLALLRLAQGQAEAAEAAIRRVLAATSNRVHRARQLPAQVEILIARGDVEAARRSCDELAAIADVLDTEMLRAALGRARGAVALAEGDPSSALADLSGALQSWQRLEAPYQAARTRELLALACRALGDEEGARLEREAARAAFERLGAAPDLARLDAPTGVPRPHGLTRRELEVLRLVAKGQTNRVVADTLGLSVKTIDRHVSNIFDKLGVSSRAAATAFAYEHDLI